MFKILFIATVLLAAVGASPLGSPMKVLDEPPKLSDTLAVAKSPFEPITLARAADPNVHLDSPTTVSMDQEEEDKRTTRSAQAVAFTVQETDTTPVRVGLEEQPAADGGSAAASTSEPSTSTTPFESAAETTTSSAAETEAASTKAERQADETTSTTPSPATDITLGTTTTTTTEAPSTTAEEITSTAAAEAAAETQPPEAAPAVVAATTTIAPSTIDEGTTKQPEVDEPKPKEKDVEKPPAEITSTTLAETTTTTVAPPTEPATSEQPATTEQPTTSAPTTITTTTQAPETTQAPTTAKPAESQDKKPQDEPVRQQQTAMGCNHLPSYDPEEVQKVFREETTFRNGTIKGKFTYINFDSRYRLVHYTRLPYGPVKIDQVEELGRPEPATSSNTNTNSSRSPTANEIPNAVLQLRNILPNSLYGFPFVSPNSAANKPLDPRDGVSSPGSSFYSTEALSTPNLLTPSVPVSSLSGRREPLPDAAPPAANQQDTLSQNLNDNIALSVAPPSPAQHSAVPGQQTSAPKLANSAPAWSPDLYPPNTNSLQFQYALATQANQIDQHNLHNSNKQLNSGNSAYSYISGNQPSAQYQYSPLPLYTFQQPSYFASPHPHSIPVQTLAIASLSKPAAPLVSHQPHDHEHYIAPFMLSRSSSSTERGEQPTEQPEQPTRLKLRVKSAKSLNPSGAKSAQLRAQEESGQQQQYQHHSSPAQAYRQSANKIHQEGRHRAGKQNQELRPTVNSTPVVYHVLRSPMGQMYSLRQYRNMQHPVGYDLYE